MAIALLLATHAIAHEAGSTPSPSGSIASAPSAGTCRGEAARTCPAMRLVGVALPSQGCVSRESQARLFILRRLCQDAQPDVVALIEPLDGDTRAVRVGGTQAMG